MPNGNSLIFIQARLWLSVLVRTPQVVMSSHIFLPHQYCTHLLLQWAATLTASCLIHAALHLNRDHLLRRQKSWQKRQRRGTHQAQFPRHNYLPDRAWCCCSSCWSGWDCATRSPWCPTYPISTEEAVLCDSKCAMIQSLISERL